MASNSELKWKRSSADLTAGSGALELLSSSAVFSFFPEAIQRKKLIFDNQILKKSSSYVIQISCFMSIKHHLLMEKGKLTCFLSHFLRDLETKEFILKDITRVRRAPEKADLVCCMLTRT